MRAALIAPNYSAANRGNGVTVRRIERHLREEGCEVAVFQPEELSAGELLRLVASFSPDCIHAFHAIHGGLAAKAVAAGLDLPYVITLTGTDLFGRMDDLSAVSLAAVLADAAAIAVFHESLRGWVAQRIGVAESSIAVIPQGVDLPKSVPAEGEGDFVFLLPAGLRHVKNVLFPIAPLVELVREHPRVRLRIVGPVLDGAYGETVKSSLSGLSWASYSGEVEFGRMGDEYAAAHVVLNTSLSEGGMANSLLEAMAHGRPVLAADIEGNRSLVKDGINGLLYRDEAEFASRAASLVSDPALRQRLAGNARCFVRENCSARDEAQKYLDLYGRAAAGR